MLVKDKKAINEEGKKARFNFRPLLKAAGALMFLAGMLAVLGAITGALTAEASLMAGLRVNFFLGAAGALVGGYLFSRTQ